MAPLCLPWGSAHQSSWRINSLHTLSAFGYFEEGCPEYEFTNICWKSWVSVPWVNFLRTLLTADASHRTKIVHRGKLVPSQKYHPLASEVTLQLLTVL